MYFPDQAPPTLDAFRTIWGPHTDVFIAALLISLLLTPVFRALAVRLGVYDMPDLQLKPHGKPIPYLGGLAIFIGTIIPLVAILLFGQPHQPRALLAVIVGATLITTTGLLDDLVSLKPYQKIIAQVAAALILVAGGVIFRAIPLNIGDIPFGSLSPTATSVANLALQVFLVVAACNATNLLDGLDGLCSGVTAIISVGFLLLATSIAGWYIWGGAPRYELAVPIIVISLALLGASIGFLPYNFNPASIFMGDAGSMLLGFVCATLMIMFCEHAGLVKWLVGSLLIFGLPIFDTGLAFTRRYLNGKPIFLGDRSHFYDQLVDRGLSVRQAVLACYGLALLFVLIGLGSLFVRTRYGILITLSVVVMAGLIVKKAGMLRVDNNAGAAGSPRQTTAADAEKTA